MWTGCMVQDGVQGQGSLGSWHSFLPLEGADSQKGMERVDTTQVPLAAILTPSDRLLRLGWVGAAWLAPLPVVCAHVSDAISSCSVNTWC